MEWGNEDDLCVNWIKVREGCADRQPPSLVPTWLNSVARQSQIDWR